VEGRSEFSRDDDGRVGAGLSNCGGDRFGVEHGDYWTGAVVQNVVRFAQGAQGSRTDVEVPLSIVLCIVRQIRFLCGAKL
jgi:hypothetical protein